MKHDLLLTLGAWGRERRDGPKLLRLVFRLVLILSRQVESLGPLRIAPVTPEKEPDQPKSDHAKRGTNCSAYNHSCVRA